MQTYDIAKQNHNVSKNAFLIITLQRYHQWLMHPLLWPFAISQSCTEALLNKALIPKNDSNLLGITNKNKNHEEIWCQSTNDVAHGYCYHKNNTAHRMEFKFKSNLTFDLISVCDPLWMHTNSINFLGEDKSRTNGFPSLSMPSLDAASYIERGSPEVWQDRSLDIQKFRRTAGFLWHVQRSFYFKT